jgi:hypothetical protein
VPALLKNIRPRVDHRERYAIHNGRGDFWSPRVFESVEAAETHMKQFWGANSVPKSHGIVPVRVTIQALPQKSK